MLKNDTLKNGTSPVGLYGSAPPPRGWNCSHLVPVEFKSGSPDVKHTIYEMHLNFLIVILHFTDPGFSLNLCCPLKISEKEKKRTIEAINQCLKIMVIVFCLSGRKPGSSVRKHTEKLFNAPLKVINSCLAPAKKVLPSNKRPRKKSKNF